MNNQSSDKTAFCRSHGAGDELNAAKSLKS